MPERLGNHGPHCFGCGPENPCSLGLVMYGEDERVWGELTIDERHQGAPGFAHGGAIATALDDAFGMVLRLLEIAAVTVNLDINYRRPWLVDEPHRVEAELERRDKRKLYMSGRALDAESRLVVETTALYLIVGVDHFMRGVERAGVQRSDLPW